MDAQFLIGLDPPEIGETGGMGQHHARGDCLPAVIRRQVFVRAVLVWVDLFRLVIRQRFVEIIGQRRIEFQRALVDQLQDGIGEDGLGQRGAVHHGVGLQRIALGVADAIRLDVTDLAVIDDGYGQPLGAGPGHDLAGFGVYRLGRRQFWGRHCDGRQEEKRTQRKGTIEHGDLRWLELFWGLGPMAPSLPFLAFPSSLETKEKQEKEQMWDHGPQTP